MSAYLLDVNPFNQPGVEAYKSILKTKLKELKEKTDDKKAEEGF
jgi:glucose-6-phosphate isomerase